MSQRDLLTRLADRGEEMLNKFAETPGASRVLELMNSMRETFEMPGTPIRMWLRSGKNPYAKDQ